MIEEKEWKKRFTKEFTHDIFEYIPAKWSKLRADGSRVAIPLKTPRIKKRLIKFIDQALQTQRQEIKSKVEGMKKKEELVNVYRESDGYSWRETQMSFENRVFNEALDQVIQIIKEEYGE